MKALRGFLIYSIVFFLQTNRTGGELTISVTICRLDAAEETHAEEPELSGAAAGAAAGAWWTSSAVEGGRTQ